jgi:hypothetical protein
MNRWHPETEKLSSADEIAVANWQSEIDRTTPCPRVEAAKKALREIPASCLGDRASGTLRYEGATGQIWRDRSRGKALHT